MKDKLTFRLDDKDMDRIEYLAAKNDISKSEVGRKAIKFALSWNKKSFWQKVKRCFFKF